MRKAVVSVAVAGGVAAAAFSACGGSSSNANSSGSDAGSEASIIRRADAGVGGYGDAGVAVVVPPTGTQVLSFPTAYLEGVTDDGYAVYQDTATNSLYAVS